MLDQLQQLGVIKYPGSSVEPGVPYQDIPAYRIPGARNNTRLRANRVAELVNIKDKHILDLGCNVGTMSRRFWELGARVTGVDYDPASIAVAQNLNRGPLYLVQEITLEFIQQLPQYDIIVWTSQFMWLAKQHGMDYALDCLWEIGRHCDTLVFETAARDDGSAPLTISQEEVMGLLCRNTIFRRIINTGQWNDLWTPRDVFVCSNPLMHYDGFFSSVDTRHTRGQVVKKFKDTAYARELKARSSMFLGEMSERGCVPRVLAEDDLSLTMSWEGPYASHITGRNLERIVFALYDKRITHRDIRPDNLLFNGSRVILIDFAFAVRPGELAQTSHDLGKPYRCPTGFDDDYSIRKVQQELLAK